MKPLRQRRHSRASAFITLAGLAFLASCSGSQETVNASPEGVARSDDIAETTPGEPIADNEQDPCDWEAGGQLGIPRCPNTGDPLPEPRVSNPACRDSGASATRWLAMSPHTPLAITDNELGIVTAGHPCCAPWARRGARYRSLDAWGQVAGVVEVSGGAGYDVTRCFELSLSSVSGRDAELIYASLDGGWQPGASMQWQADDDARESFAAFVEAVMQVTVVDPQAQRHFERDDPLPPLADRTLFFQVEEEAIDGRSRTTNHYAVAGGRLLIIAWRSLEGKWILTHMENDLTNFEFSPINTYRPVAVVDMDGDEVPEIIFHWNEGPAWGQVVLQRSTVRGGWSVIAQSIGGSTA